MQHTAYSHRSLHVPKLQYNIICVDFVNDHGLVYNEQKAKFMCMKPAALKTRSTQRVQTSLAEADHYSYMPTVKMSRTSPTLLPPSPRTVL